MVLSDLIVIYSIDWIWFESISYIYIEFWEGSVGWQRVAHLQNQTNKCQHLFEYNQNFYDESIKLSTGLIDLLLMIWLFLEMNLNDEWWWIDWIWK